MDPFSVWVLELSTEEDDILSLKKETISMYSCRYLIDPPYLATTKKTFCIVTELTGYCMPVSC